MGCGRGSPFRVRVGMTRGPVAIRGSSQAALQVGAAQAWGVPKIGLQSLIMYLPTAGKPDGQVPGLNVRGVYDGTMAEAKAALGPCGKRRFCDGHSCRKYWGE